MVLTKLIGPVVEKVVSHEIPLRRMPLRAGALPSQRRSCCSICTKKGFLHLIVARDQFELISGNDDLTTYRFNTGVAQHMFCKHCGMHPFYVPRSDPDKIDVNVRCLDGIDLKAIKIKEFDGRDWEAAMQQEVPWR